MAENKKGLAILYVILAVIIVLSVAGTVYFLSENEKNTVEIISDGQVLYRINLLTEQNKTIRIEHGGSYNTVEIKDGEIFVSEAGCPDKTCVKTGKLKGGMPIVCLPNRLVIRFANGGEVDAVAGQAA